MRSFKAAGAVLLAGTAMLLSGCGGHSAERVIHKDPQTVYTQFDEMFAQAAERGNNGEAAAEGQVTSIERDPGKSLDIKVTMEGKQAIDMKLGFEPVSGGTETKVTGDMIVDQDVMNAAMDKRAGGGIHHASHIPSFAFGLVMQKMLDAFGQSIDQGMPLTSSGSVMAMASPPESTMPTQSVEQREYQAEASQRAATAPMVDPNQSARQYLHQQ
jgi:hypothetical protein